MEQPCKRWRGAKENGYGRRRINGKLVYVHRQSFEDTYGPIPNSMIVRHKCDVRDCYEPTHLELGTHKQNAKDRVARGRQKSNKGGRNGRAILTAKQVRSIRKEYAKGNTTQRALAQKHKVSLYCIFAIVNHKTWTHISE